MKRRNFTSKFKTKVVLEALKESKGLSELAMKHELAPAQISKWKRDFLSGAEYACPQTLDSFTANLRWNAVRD